MYIKTAHVARVMGMTTREFITIKKQLAPDMDGLAYRNGKRGRPLRMYAVGDVIDLFDRVFANGIGADRIRQLFEASEPAKVLA